MRAMLICLGLGVLGCGPSPAMQSNVTQVTRVAPCDCDADDDAYDVEDAPPAKPVAYVRIDEWQPPASVQAIEARIEPRGNKPPDYVHMPALTLHREIAPMTTWRTGRYWR